MTPRLHAAAIAAATAAWFLVHLRSPAVQAWEPPRRDRLPAGPLHLASAGGFVTDDEEPVAVLLHGIAASSRSFGRVWDDLPGQVLVLDLLGFGMSLHASLDDDFTREAHVTAVVETLRRAGVHDRPVVLVGHSMGAVLALHTAAALPDVRAVVAMSAPLYDAEDEGMSRIGEADPLAQLLAVGAAAQRVCEWMCAHRSTARLLVPLVTPRWPVPVARDGVLHTWPAYRQSLEHLVLDSGYIDAVEHLREDDIPLLLLDGEHDGVPVSGRSADLASRHPRWRSVTVAGADHALPVSHAARCLEEIVRFLA